MIVVGVHEPSESRDQADFTLRDWFEGVGAAETAWNGTQATKTFTKSVD